MSFISCYGNPQFKNIPLLADEITTDEITFSDGSTLTSADIVTANTLTVTGNLTVGGDLETTNLHFPTYTDNQIVPFYQQSINGAMFYSIKSINETDAFGSLPFYCSVTDFNLVGVISTGLDCGWLIMPYYRIVLYSATGYSGVESITLENITNKPVLYSCYDGETLSYPGATPITKAAGGTPPDNYWLNNVTKSLRLYKYNTSILGNWEEITLVGLSS